MALPTEDRMLIFVMLQLLIIFTSAAVGVLFTLAMTKPEGSE